MEFSAFVVFFAAIIASRVIHERGYRLLNAEEKVRLMDGFSRARAYSLIPILLLLGGYWLLITKTDFNRYVINSGYFGLLILYVVVRTWMNRKKLASLDLPPGYRRYFTISQIVSLIGVAWFFFALFQSIAGQAPSPPSIMEISRPASPGAGR